MTFRRSLGRTPTEGSLKPSGPADRLRVFVSHSHLDREVAELVKTELEDQWGFVAFVAHKDISPSLQWRDEIRNELKACDIFLALLGPNWKGSNWTDQEAGIAVASGKVVIPVSIGEVMPYGFLETYQALGWDLQNTRESLRSLVRSILGRVAVEVEALIHAFERTPTVEDAGFRIRLLLPLRLTNSQATRVAGAALLNKRNRDSTAAREDIRAFLRARWEAVDTRLRADLAKTFGLTGYLPPTKAEDRLRLKPRMLLRRFVFEDLFLVGREGRLIMHTTRRLRADRDSDILVGMLTAIMLFVRDSFKEESEDLKRFEFGDRQVAVERGEHAYAAAIFAGQIPRGLTQHLRRFLTDVELRYGGVLVEWSGDVEDLPGLRDMMETFGRRGRWRSGS